MSALRWTRQVGLSRCLRGRSKMAINNKSIPGDQKHESKFALLDPDDLKNVVRNELLSMSSADRELVVETLESEMERANFNMRSYLIPLGVLARTPAELTPTEIGHLVRFLNINVPGAMPVVERAIAQFPAFAKYREP